MGQQAVGKYRILDRIASGTQGAVYRAFDPESQRIVALKVLHPSLIEDASYIERFHREATLTASVDHPNVVVIYEVGSDGDQHYIALEFLPESLHGLIESGALPVANAAGLAAGIADGLGAVHKLGIVHRDMKPQNVLITPDGTPKVTDFGIARGGALSTMTATGMIMGTPYYMSPEQAEGHRVDARTDVYALGCVLYQMLSGEVPFSGDTPFSVIRKHLEQEPRPIRTLRRDVPRGLADVIAKAMSKRPEGRYADGAEMAQAIRIAVPGIRSVAVTPPRTPADTADLPAPVDPPAATPPPRPPVGSRTYLPAPGRPRQLFLMVSGAAVVAIVAAVAALIFSGGGNGSPNATDLVPAAPTERPAPAPTATAISPAPTATRVPVAPTPEATATPAPTATPTSTLAPAPELISDQPEPVPARAPTGLLAWWPAEGHANDIAGRSHGTMREGAVYAPGKVGLAFSFEGDGDYVAIPDSPNLDVSSMTVDAWININGHDEPAYNIASRWFVAPGNGGELSWEFGVTVGKLGASISSDCNTRSHSVIGTRTLDIGTWYHVALVIDGTSNKVRLYLDGQLDLEFNIFGFCGISDTLLQIGDGRPGLGINGLVDEFRFYRRAVTGAEIKAIYEAGSAGIVVPTGTSNTPDMTVTSPVDATDANPGDGVCDDGTGSCTLRAAIMEANAFSGADTITLPEGTYTLSIAGTGEDGAATGDLDITDNVTITGAGADDTIIDADEIDRVIHVLFPSTLNITGVTIRNGLTALADYRGGGILNMGVLSMSHSSVIGNAAKGGVARAQGGGVYNGGVLRIANSEISGNSSDIGGGIDNTATAAITNSVIHGNAGNTGAGINNVGGEMTLTGSTISGNATPDSGGGIYNASGAKLEIVNSTISGNNAASNGAAIWDEGAGTELSITNSTLAGNSAPGSSVWSGGDVRFTNTIIAGNLFGNLCAGGGFTSLGHNLASDGTCNLAEPTDLPNADPRLGPLQDNGGPTETHALSPGSPAIDAGNDAAALETDQRGVARPQGAASDIGAFELGQATPAPTPTPTPKPAPTPTPAPKIKSLSVWRPTESMAGPRQDHAAVLLDDGTVLIVGGTSATAELYHPEIEVFGSLGSVPFSQGVRATKLSDGRVLVVGQSGGTTAMIYDPPSRQFMATGSLNIARAYSSVTLLPDGKVLVAGGQKRVEGGPQTLAVAEVYDPATGIFTLTESLNEHRSIHAAVLLPNGKVLIVGGSQTATPGSGVTLTAAELYDPASGTFSVIGNTISAHSNLSIGGVILLPTGKVLIAGGAGNEAELFDPATGTFTRTGNLTATRRSAHSSTLLPDGQVLLAGGFNAPGPNVIGSAELYNPISGTFSPIAGMAQPRQQHTATLLPNGDVLVIGGFGGVSVLSTAELWILESTVGPAPTPMPTPMPTSTPAPTPTPTAAVPTPEPTAFPLPVGVIATGLIELSPFDAADFDEGKLVPRNQEADIGYEVVSNEERLIFPFAGAGIVMIGFDPPGRAGCAAAVHSPFGFNIHDIPDGTYFCVITRDGNNSEIRLITNVPGPGTYLQFTYTTWSS